MKRVVVSLAIAVDPDAASRGRAADIAAQSIRRWTGGDPQENERITLLSARWEADDPVTIR